MAWKQEAMELNEHKVAQAGVTSSLLPTVTSLGPLKERLHAYMNFVLSLYCVVYEGTYMYSCLHVYMCSSNCTYSVFVHDRQAFVYMCTYNLVFVYSFLCTYTGVVFMIEHVCV